MTHTSASSISAPSLLSVVIPTFQRTDLLAKCLARLAPGAQSLDAERYEVIVTDDSAPEHSAQSLISNNFPWARWSAGPRRGPAANRNHGAALAAGAWLVFTDDDCLPEAGWLLAIADAAERGCRVIEGRTTSEADWKGPLWTAPVNEHGGYLWSCNFAIERKLFQDLGAFDPGFPYAHLEDVDLRMRIGAAGDTLHFVPAAQVVHPQRPIGRIWKNVRAHESCFYFSAKHNVSLAEAGISWAHLVRVKIKRILHSPNRTQALRFAVRSAAEAILVLAYSPWWSWKYFTRHGRPRRVGPVGGTRPNASAVRAEAVVRSKD